MNKDEALKLALQFLESMMTHQWRARDIYNLKDAIKEALAQPEPWEKFCDSNCVWTDHHPDCKLAQRKPLTNEEVYKASTEAKMQEHYMGFHSGFINFARAIEAAHGIKGEA